MKKIDIFFDSLSFLTLKYDFFSGHFRLTEVIETPTKPQFQPLSMPSKRVWANILSGAAVIERPDLILEKKTRLCVMSRYLCHTSGDPNFFIWIMIKDFLLRSLIATCE